MRKRIKRAQALLLSLIALSGLMLGVGVTLLVLNLTRDEKSLTFYGLICLIFVAFLCLILPFITIHRDALIEQATISNLLFGCDTTFLSEEAFLRHIKKKNGEPVLALHARIFYSNELLMKQVRFAFAKSLQAHLEKKMVVGYGNEGDFLFLGQKDHLLEILAAIEKEMLEDDELPPFALLLGASIEEKDAQTKIYQAKAAATSFASSRGSLSCLNYQEESIIEGFDLEQEKEMGRLEFRFDEYSKDGEILALANPDLYDPIRGHVLGKDLFHRADLYYVRVKLDEMVIAHALDYLKEHASHRVILRLGLAFVEDALSLSHLVEGAAKAGVTPDRFYLLLHASDFSSLSSRSFYAHAKALGFHIGVYEYGGEDVLALTKIAPELMTLKPENLRQGANEEELAALISIVSNVHASLFIEASDFHHEHSDYFPYEELEQEEEAA